MILPSKIFFLSHLLPGLRTCTSYYYIPPLAFTHKKFFFSLGLLCFKIQKNIYIFFFCHSGYPAFIQTKLFSFFVFLYFWHPSPPPFKAQSISTKRPRKVLFFQASIDSTKSNQNQISWVPATRLNYPRD